MGLTSSSNRNNMDKSQKFGPNKTDVQKNTNNANNQQEQDQDDLRKKRCADRYDSSESSDSGVATLRCIDSSTASSDTSDPGSPYSSNSNCEDNNPSCTGTLTSSAKSVSSNISSETRIESKLHNTTNTLLPEQKSESSSYQLIPLVNRSKWPWNASAPDGAPASAAAILATSSISRNKSQQDAISHITSIKHIQTTSDSTINIDNTTVVETSIPTLVPTAEIGSVYKNLKRSSQSANDISSLVGSIKRVRMQINVAVEQKSLFTSNGKKIDTATLSQQPRPVETMASPQTKITGYFKSQIKPMNSLSQTSLLTNKKDLTNMVVRSTEFPPKKRQPKNRTKVKTTEAKNINTSVVKKMPKTVAQYNKKPVTIAPRIIETKVNLHAHSRTNQPTVVLTAIRIPPQTLQTPSTITTNMPEQQLRGPQTQSPQSTVNTEQLYHSVMPNLVQIPNLHLPKSTNIMLNANTNQFRNSSQYCVLNGAVIKLQTSDGKNLSPQTTKHFSNQSVGQSLFMPNGLLVNTSMQAMLSPTFTSHHSLGQQQQQGHQTTNTSLQMPSLHRILPHHNQNHQPQHQTAHHNILPLSSLLSSNHPPSLVPISTQTPLSNGAVSAYIPPNTSLSSSPMISNIPSPIVSNLSHLTPFSTCASTVVTSTTMCSAVMVQSTQPQQQSSYLHTNTQATTSLSSSSSSATASMLPYVNNGYGTIVTSNSFNFKNNPITNQLLYSAITSTTTSALATSVTKALSSSSALQLATTSVLPSNALSQFNNAVFKKLPINLPNTNVDTTASSISSDAKSTEDMFSCADIVRNFKKLETTEKKPTNSALESNNSLISSNSISLTSTRIPQTSIKSSSPPPLQRIQKYLQDPQSVVSSFTTTHSNASSACGSSSQMASPKSLVLERIQKKTTTQIIEIEKISSHCNRTRYSTDYNSSTTKQLMLSTTCIETDPKYHSDCAKSPILQQPKTIRFPAPHGVHSSNFRKSDGKITGVCYWDECNAKYDTSSLLLDHMQTQHVNTQIGPFACAWAGCKVHSRQSCSRRWLERHVLSHGGTKPFKCIVEGCGLRFGSQLALQKHVNAHFTNTDISKELTTKRSSDPPIPKQLRKNGKKLRYRRQPFSARMFDFFDNGIMEGLQYRLHVMAGILNQQGDIVFKGQSLARRVGKSGEQELLVKWSPCNIICNEWVKTTSNCLTKSVPILKMSASERVALEEYFKLANKGHMEEESAEANEFQKIHFGADVGELKNPPQTPKRSRKQQPMRTPS